MKKILLLTVWAATAGAQFATVGRNGLWLDPDGKEVRAFGVNYAAPFAHAYRRIEQLGLSHKQTIDQDVYHFARLGFDAYRIHVWDIEISDANGNLLKNDHLDLFDYLVNRLKERDIPILLTPLFLGDNGYPDGPTAPPGFASGRHRKEMVTNEKFAAAQTNYLRQFLDYVNPYTGLAYKEDPSVIAIELVNEPWHDGSKEQISSHIDSLIRAVKNTGCKAPVFYNMSQNPYLRDVYYRLGFDGFCFQWYPAGLTGRQNTMNLLPQTGSYPLFFSGDPEFKKSAKAVYELSLASVPTAYAYPVMAQTLREAGFQFAAYFCYDPLAIAAYNSEYPTHFLNLAYTPRHAINLMIAAEVFRGNDAFSVDAAADQSLLNDGQKFYYSNGTIVPPLNPTGLQQIAGCGSSPIVQYEGTGAYFLDRLHEGAWRLEVMPDPYLLVENPFQYRKDKSPVADVKWEIHSMKLSLSDLGKVFTVEPLNSENAFSTETNTGTFEIRPGTYLLRRTGILNRWTPESRLRNFNIGEFAAPPHLFSHLSPHRADRRSASAELFNAANRYNNHLIRSAGADRKLETETYRDGFFEVAIPAKALTWGSPFVEWSLLLQVPLPDQQFDELIIEALPLYDTPCPVQFAFQLDDGTVFAAQDVIRPRTDTLSIPLSSFQKTETARIECNPSLLPVETGFTGPSEQLDLSRIRLVQFRIGPGLSPQQIQEPNGLKIKRILLK